MSSTAKKYGQKRKKLRSVPLSVPNSVLNLEINSIPIDYSRIYHEKLVWKQGLDLFFGIVGTLIFMLIYPFIALGIKLSSNGPIIFKQERSGFRSEERRVVNAC